MRRESYRTAVKEHAKCAKKYLMKLIAFFKCNTDMPFIVKKKKAMDAAFMSAIMYGCESWLGVCVKDMDNIYHAALKALLGVRTTTVNDLCLAELGYPLLKYYVLQRQRWIFKKMIDSRSGLGDDPLMLAINVAQDSGSKMGTVIDMVTQSDDYMVLGLINLRERIQESERSKYVMYKIVNPSLSVHNVYKRGGNEYVPEYLRVSFTRLRLSSHRLMIETGRWSRIPRENRLCACGVIQDEAHVIQVCPNVGHIRQRYDVLPTYPDFVIEASSSDHFKYSHEILSYFEGS